MTLLADVLGVRQNDLGNGTILYEGIQDMNTVQVTAWRLSMFGGIWMANNDIRYVGRTIGVLTGSSNELYLQRWLR